MNYEHYKIFVTVGKYKNITRAAEELFTSQPAVTRVIHGLESELGCTLFIRSKNGVEFTREGKDLYDLLDAPCTLLARADSDIKRSAGRNVETIYIGTTDTAMQCFLFDFLAYFRRQNPQINIKLHTGSSTRMIAKLRNMEIDLVFNTTPFSGAQSFSVTPVCSFSDIVVAGNTYRDLEGKEVTLNDLKKYPFILLSKDMQYRQFCDVFFAKHNVDILPALEADSSRLIVPMVEHDWGIAFVPAEMAAESIKSGNMFRINLKEEIPKRHVTMVVDPDRPLSKAAQHMYDLALGG